MGAPIALQQNKQAFYIFICSLKSLTEIASGDGISHLQGGVLVIVFN